MLGESEGGGGKEEVMSCCDEDTTTSCDNCCSGGVVEVVKEAGDMGALSPPEGCSLDSVAAATSGKQKSSAICNTTFLSMKMKCTDIT